MTPKSVTAVTAGVLVVAVLLTLALRWQNREVRVAEAVGPPPIAQGDPDAVNKLVSILSPTCSHCADHEAQNGAVLAAAVTDGVLYRAVYPVTTTRGAKSYTYGFLCAAKQEAFDRYTQTHYQSYFGGGERLGSSATARTIGLDVDAFRQCLNSAEIAAEAKRIQLWATQIGVVATPTFFRSLPEGEWLQVRGERSSDYWQTWLSGK